MSLLMFGKLPENGEREEREMDSHDENEDLEETEKLIETTNYLHYVENECETDTGPETASAEGESVGDVESSDSSEGEESEGIASEVVDQVDGAVAAAAVLEGTQQESDAPHGDGDGDSTDVLGVPPVNIITALAKRQQRKAQLANRNGVDVGHRTSRHKMRDIGEQQGLLSSLHSQRLSRFPKKAEELPMKFGALEKKSPNKLVGWQMRWLSLAEKRLMYFKTEDAVKAAGIIDFDLVKCEIECLWAKDAFPAVDAVATNNSDQYTGLWSVLACCGGRDYKARDCCKLGGGKPNILDKIVRFRIRPDNCPRAFEFRGRFEEVASWVQAIGKHLKVATQLYDPFVVTANPKFWAVVQIAPYKFGEIADTGDVVLFRSRHAAARLQRAVTGGRYDHVGMVIRKANGEIYVLEALGDKGVCLTNWEKFVELGWGKEYKRVALRRMQFTRSAERLEKLLLFCWKHVGKPYGLTFEKLLRIDSMHSEPPDFFCSELVCQAWKTLEVIPKDTIVSTQVYPSNFEEDTKAPIPLAKHCVFTPCCIVNFDMPAKRPPNF